MTLVVMLSYFAAAITAFPGVPFLAVDTVTYIARDPLIPIGYPAFLSGVFALTGTLMTTSIVQVALYFAACLAVVLAMWGLSRIAASAAGLLLVQPSGLVTYHLTLLTESPVASLVVLHIASVACAIRRPGSVWAFCAAGAAAGAAILVRPSSWFLLFWSPRPDRRVARPTPEDRDLLDWSARRHRGRRSDL
jgi:hypothetical protein